MSPPESVHVPVDGIGPAADGLAFDGVAFAELAERAGRTPFYAYSTQALIRRVALARAMLPPGARLHYAVKANPFEPLVRAMAGLVDGADVASAGEMRLALACGFEAADIGLVGPARRAAELDEAAACGVTVTAESERQLRGIAEAAGRAGVPAVAALRVNPAHELRASGMRMGGGTSAFGIDEEAVPSMLALADRLGVRIAGLHFFPGSQNLRAEAIAQALVANAHAALRLMQGRAGWRWLNLGGGFGVPYAAGERDIEPEPIRQALAEIDATLGRPDATTIADGAASAGTGTTASRARPTLRIELGRFLVADAGAYVCRVLDRKVSRGRTIVVVDGGLHHNQAATGNFGQVLKRPYPIVNASRPHAALVKADVVGPLCTPMDCFGREVALPDPQPGDLIAVLRSGAYGRSASPGAFLGHEDCLEVQFGPHGTVSGLAGPPAVAVVAPARFQERSNDA